MSTISELDIQQYSKIITDAEKTLINHQETTGIEVALSNNLISALVQLRKLLLQLISQKEWFDNYFGVFNTYFLNSKIKSYTDLVIKELKGIWIALSIAEKIEIAKITDTLYNFPNFTILTSENFEERIKRRYQTSVKTLALANKLELNFGKEYKPNLGVNEFIFSITGKEDIKLQIYVWVHDAFIKIETKNEGIPTSLSNLFLKALFHNMFG